MPGMMDTILNLGLNDQTVEALATKTGNPRFAWDCYRRFVQMYGDVVLGVQKRPDEDHDPFETVIHGLKHERYHQDIEDTKLTRRRSARSSSSRFKALVKERAGKQFPSSPWDQLLGAVGAVFGSWMNDRAIVYRRKYNIPTEWGTAVNVQAMVYGNTGDNSGSGVAFTRNPANGVKEFYGEFLINAQGEDVVAGVRTPEPVAELKKQMPKAYAELERIRQTLEKHFKDVQDFEFTIEDGVVYMLQTRNGKRTAMAALKFSVDMYKEKLIDWKTAVMRNPADQLEQLLAPVFDLAEVAKAKAIATGLPAGPGAASGQIYLNADRAVAAADKGEKVLLVRVETSPEDLRGMIAAEGILTARGGVSSHAALVARQMGKVCVCGAAAVEVDYQARTVTVDGQTFKEGDWMSIDGTVGKVYAGQVKTAPSEIVAGLINGDKAAQADREVQELPAADEVVLGRDAHERPHQRRYAGADGQRRRVRRRRHRPDPHRAHVLRGRSHRRDARDDPRRDGRGAEGRARQAAAVPARGLRRHLPRAEGLPGDDSLPRPAAARVPAAHQGAAGGAGEEDRRAGGAHPAARRSSCTSSTRCSASAAAASASAIPKSRRCRRARCSRPRRMVQKEGIKVRPEIMIPLVGFKKELDLQIEVVHQAAREVQAEKKVKLNYMVGTMIEIPRGALTADEIAQSAEFFSFGTNDLTQTGLGMSRDDSGSFLPQYQELEIVKKNPFATIDATGVGQLVEIAVTKGRADAPEPEARDLRRARRRSGVDPVLREGRARLRELLAVSRAGRAAGGGAGGAAGQGRGLISRSTSTRAGPPRSSTGWTRPGSSRAAASRSGSTSTADAGGEPRSSPTSFTSTSSPSKTRSAEIHHPKIESYGDYLYLILHGIDFQRARSTRSARRTSISSSARSYLVTVHHGASRSIEQDRRDLHAQRPACSAKARRR